MLRPKGSGQRPARHALDLVRKAITNSNCQAMQDRDDWPMTVRAGAGGRVGRRGVGSVFAAIRHQDHGFKVEFRPYLAIDDDGRELPLVKADAIALGVRFARNGTRQARHGSGGRQKQASEHAPRLTLTG